MHSFTETQPSEPETCRSVMHRRGAHSAPRRHTATDSLLRQRRRSGPQRAHRARTRIARRTSAVAGHCSWVVGAGTGTRTPGLLITSHPALSAVLPGVCAGRCRARGLELSALIDDAGRVGSGRVVEHVKQPTVWRVAVARGACASGHRRAERALRVQARKSEVVVTRLTDAATAPTTTTRSRSPEGRYVSPPLSVAFAPRSPEPTARGAEPRRQARTAPWRAEPLWIHVD